MLTTRPPAVADRFYPGDPLVLQRAVSIYLHEGETQACRAEHIKALVAPHAGYMYSGSIAGSAYASLKACAGRIRRVVLLGPCHYVGISGLALPGARAMQTPLGEVPVDVAAAEKVLRLPQVREHAEAHRQEHALEVQLPFFAGGAV